MKRKIGQSKNSKVLITDTNYENSDSILKKEVEPNSKRKKRRKLNSDEAELKNLKDIESKYKSNIEKEKSTQINEILEESDDSNHENTQKLEITKKESNELNGKFLRNAFNSADGYAILHKFVAFCDQNATNKKKNLVDEYLEAGGSVLEILRLLDNSDKRNVNNITTVFTAMHIIIMKILAKYPQNQSSTEEACRHLINSHLNSIHSMLSSQGKAKHRKVVLRLLAAIVSLGGTLPHELLNHLSLHPQLVDVLTSHSKPSDPQNVRTCFIHLILAFLIEGNATNIRTLLEKRAVFSGIFSGLVYDHSDVVQLVLATMKKYVLENPTVSKTMKLHLFSTPVIKNIVSLYHWKGPENWRKHNNQNTIQECVNPEQKKIIDNTVHEFLITLLTSSRHGVAFYDRSMGTEFNSKHNQLINTILQSLDKPWEHNKISDLVIKILSACPDLIKPQLIYTEPFLAPRISRNWIGVIQFVKKIINNINVETCLNLCSIDVSLQQLANLTLNLILPPIIIKNAIFPSMEHDNILIHHEIIDVLLTILKKIESLLIGFQNSKHNRSEYIHFKNIVSDYMSKHMPTFESILNIWTSAFSVIKDTEIISDDLLHSHVNVKDHLMAILNVLHVYSENFPDILYIENLTNVKNQPVTLLTNLDQIENINEQDIVVMKVKALKILTSLNISDFHPNKNLFSSALSFLMSKMGMNNILLDSEVFKTIYLLLNKCEIFEEHNDEVEIFVNVITHFNSPEHKLEIANWITKIIKRVSKHTEKYMSVKYNNEKNTKDDLLENTKQEDIFTTLNEKNIKNVKFLVPILPANSLSLLVYGAVENYRENSSQTIANYLSYVLTYILHCQISPKALISLTEELVIPFQKYVTRWKENQPSTLSKKLFNSKNVFSVFNKILLNCDVYEIKIAESKLCIQCGDITNEYQLTSFEVKALFRMVIFYLVQLSKENNKESQNFVMYTNILLVLLKIAENMKSTGTDTTKGCIKYIFNHPILLHNFQPIFTDSNSTKFKITTLIIEVLKSFTCFENKFSTSKVFYPYQEKLITQIKSFIRKHKDSEVESDLRIHLEVISLLRLSKETIVDLISNVMVLEKEKFITTDNCELSIWGIIIPELIKQLSSKPVLNRSEFIITLSDQLFNKLIIYTIALKRLCQKEISILENSLYEYLLKFPHSIFIIDGNIFTSFLKSEITPVSEKILELLIKRNPKFLATFIKHTNKNNNILHHKLLIFSIISYNLKYRYDEKFLRNVFELYKADIMKYLINGEECFWIKEYINVVSHLIHKYLDSTLYQDVINAILSNEKILNLVCEKRVKFIFSLFKKFSKTEPSNLRNFVQLLLHVIVIVLKKDSKNNTKLNFLCLILMESIQILKVDTEFVFDELVKYNSWSQFTRIMLKSGLKMTKYNQTEDLLLKALVATCDVAYKNNGNEEYTKTIFEMTISHSDFMNVMLSNTEIKSDLIELLWILVRKNRSLVSISHIPLYLAAYNATLAKSDQLIFRLLEFYESNNIKLNEFHPYLWGNAAAIHYSVKNESGTALWRQPSTSQVLDLLISSNVDNTIRNFPTHRNLEDDFASNETSNDQVYDPAFYLPIFNQLLRDNNVVACHKVIHSGALSLTIMACSSSCQKIRLKAFDTISKFTFHLEATRSKEKSLWTNLLEAMHNGIKKLEISIENVQLNGFVATFLARTCLIITQPLNPLYSPLHSFLMAKPAMNLNTIPELLQLYHSSEIHYQIHRHWILEVIRDGLKTNNDIDVALKCVLFKMLFDFYFSSIADKKTKDLILQIVKSATLLTKLCTILINGYSLLPWLVNVTKILKTGDAIAIKHIVEIINNIINTFKETKTREVHHNLLLIKILLSLKNNFNQDLTEECFQSFINLMNQTITNRTISKALTKDDLKGLIDFSKVFVEDLSECKLMLQFGCEFYINQALDQSISLKDALIRLLITWITYNNEK
ncbi:nucleolar pre-ribosomal-associated protein 1 [Phymastichus coffea]|uniref:nucleolar pre-ribosomal-associated protein 1 n=1 Tax=Phymastichus coffea TaxID=108790 RepID=UPI00273C338F|nr:nucleolar pre-ribosomal-associated protein 1 [Phymastichus coffea]